MAIATTMQILHDGQTNLVVQLTGISDGAGGQETNVVKVDVSDLTPVPDTLKIVKGMYDVSGGVVSLSWDAQTPEPFAHLSGPGELDYRRSNGLPNTDDTTNGDLLLSTKEFGLNSSYSITLEMKKKY